MTECIEDGVQRNNCRHTSDKWEMLATLVFLIIFALSLTALFTGHPVAAILGGVVGGLVLEVMLEQAHPRTYGSSECFSHRVGYITQETLDSTRQEVLGHNFKQRN